MLLFFSIFYFIVGGGAATLEPASLCLQAHQCGSFSRDDIMIGTEVAVWWWCDCEHARAHTHWSYRVAVYSHRGGTD